MTSLISKNGPEIPKPIMTTKNTVTMKLNLNLDNYIEYCYDDNKSGIKITKIKNNKFGIKLIQNGINVSNNWYIYKINGTFIRHKSVTFFKQFLNDANLAKKKFYNIVFTRDLRNTNIDSNNKKSSNSNNILTPKYKYKATNNMTLGNYNNVYSPKYVFKGSMSSTTPSNMFSPKFVYKGNFTPTSMLSPAYPRGPGNLLSPNFVNQFRFGDKDIDDLSFQNDSDHDSRSSLMSPMFPRLINDQKDDTDSSFSQEIRGIGNKTRLSCTMDIIQESQLEGWVFKKDGVKWFKKYMVICQDILYLFNNDKNTNEFDKCILKIELHKMSNFEIMKPKPNDKSGFTECQITMNAKNYGFKFIKNGGKPWFDKLSEYIQL